MTFDIKISTRKGALYCAYMKREVANVGVSDQNKKKKKISINLVHQIFGHVDENATRKMAEALGFELTRGNMKPCQSCVVAKAKQKNVPKIG